MLYWPKCALLQILAGTYNIYADSLKNNFFSKKISQVMATLSIIYLKNKPEDPKALKIVP